MCIDTGMCDLHRLVFRSFLFYQSWIYMQLVENSVGSLPTDENVSQTEIILTLSMSKVIKSQVITVIASICYFASS